MEVEERLQARIAAQASQPAERELWVEGDLHALLLRIYAAITAPGTGWVARLEACARSAGDWVLPSDHGGAASISGSARAAGAGTRPRRPVKARSGRA